MPTALKTKLFQARLTPLDYEKLLLLAADHQLKPVEWFRLILDREYEKRKK